MVTATRIKVIACTAFITLAVGSCFGQTVRSEQIRANLPEHSIDVAHRSLSVTLPSFSPKSGWVVAVHPATNARPSVRAGLIVFEKAVTDRPNPPGIIKAFESWPADQIHTSPGNVTIEGTSLVGDLILVVVVPQGTSVTVAAGGERVSQQVASTPFLADSEGTVALASASNSVATADGASPGKTLTQAIFRAQARRQPPAPPIVRAPTGVYVVNHDYLRAQIIAVSALSLRDPGFASRCCIPVPTMRMHVGSDGRVTRIDELLGDSTITSVIAKEAQSWRFRPFTFENRAVPVEAVFSVIKGPTGELKLSFLQ